MATRSLPPDARYYIELHAPGEGKLRRGLCRCAADAGQATRASAADLFRVRPGKGAGRWPAYFCRTLVRQSCNASAVLAATWTPDPTLAAEDDFVAPEFLWSALDCPTGYASSHDRESSSFDQTPILLGRMSARIETRPRPGERCVITAWEAGRDGRQTHSRPQPIVKPERCWPWPERHGLPSTAKFSSEAPDALGDEAFRQRLIRPPRGTFSHASRRTSPWRARGARRTSPAGAAGSDALRCLAIPGPSASRPSRARRCRR